MHYNSMYFESDKIINLNFYYQKIVFVFTFFYSLARSDFKGINIH